MTALYFADPHLLIHARDPQRDPVKRQRARIGNVPEWIVGWDRSAPITYHS
jgi:hypothetical protein